MRQLLPVLLLATALPFTANAQDPAHVPAGDPVILRVESGSVMVSQQGAEFVTVEADASLQPQDRVLVPEGSVARLDYGNGCVVSLVTGAHPVASSCPVAATATAAAEAPATTVSSSAGGLSTAAMVGIGAGVVAVGAIVSDSGSSSDPVSR